jgi:hypothetical protein
VDISGWYITGDIDYVFQAGVVILPKTDLVTSSHTKINGWTLLQAEHGKVALDIRLRKEVVVFLMHDDLCTGLVLDSANAAYMIGVAVGGNDILNLQFGTADVIEYLLFITTRIDDCSLATLLATQDITAHTHRTYNVLFCFHMDPVIF